MQNDRQDGRRGQCVYVAVLRGCGVDMFHRQAPSVWSGLVAAVGTTTRSRAQANPAYFYRGLLDFWLVVLRGTPRKTTRQRPPSATLPLVGATAASPILSLRCHLRAARCVPVSPFSALGLPMVRLLSLRLPLLNP